MTGVRWTILGCVTFIAIILAAFVFNVSRDRTPTLTDDQLLELGAFVQPRPRDISPFVLTDKNGNDFTNDSLRGQWSLLFFGFTFCPDICPATLSVLAQALPAIQKEAGDTAVNVVLISVDPDRDTPEKLKEYVGYFDESFQAATAPRDPLAEFAVQLHATFAKMPADVPGGYLVDHTGNIVVVNPRGHYHGFLRLPHTKERLEQAVPAMISRY